MRNAALQASSCCLYSLKHVTQHSVLWGPSEGAVKLQPFQFHKHHNLDFQKGICDEYYVLKVNVKRGNDGML